MQIAFWHNTIWYLALTLVSIGALTIPAAILDLLGYYTLTKILSRCLKTQVSS